jgi:Mn-dependent DtxR family transcriptional regulator
MKIAVIGDTHFGFDHYGRRQEDALRNAKEAFEIAISEKVVDDLISFMKYFEKHNG